MAHGITLQTQRSLKCLSVAKIILLNRTWPHNNIYYYYNTCTNYWSFCLYYDVTALTCFSNKLCS